MFTHSISAKPHQRPKTADPLLTNFGKKSLPLESSILVFRNGKNWQASAQLSPLSPSPQPTEFCNYENNSVIRSAMDALRNYKKN
jgi:hypothetical protein